MATSPMAELIQRLRRTALPRDGAGLTDGQLLEAYIGRRDGAALAALVQRHGPMVWGVCRRVLGDYHDAEDAFQATFLVLARKAASVRPREMVANWLYGVAHLTALKARATTARRRARERQVTDMPEPAVAEQDLWRDLQPLLDEELSRLPDRYRAVLVLCDLEGRTRREVARLLGVPEGTVAGWSARARAMLAKRLTRRGVALSGGVLAAVLSQKVASAGVPAPVVSSAIKAAGLLAAGTAAPGAISVTVTALTEGVLKAMLVTKLRVAKAILLAVAVALAGVGAGSLLHRTQAAEPVKGQQGADKKGKQAVEAPKKEPVKKDEEAVQGTWVLVRLEQVNAEPEDPKGTFKVVVAGDRITFPDKSEATFKLDPTKEPKRIDFTVERGGGATTAPGIYSLEGGELKYCLGRAGDAEPPTSFDVKKAAPGAFPTCWTFRRDEDEEQAAHPPKEDEDRLQGTWRLASAENDGLRIGEGRPEIRDDRLVIEKSSLTLSAVARSPLTKPKAIKAVADFSLDTKQTPKVLVLRWKKSLSGKEGFTQRAIYAVEGDTLKLCLYLHDENEKDPPTDFSADAGSNRILWVFKRDPASDKTDGKPKQGEEMKGDQPPAAKVPKEKEDFTAWGEEVGGLQAGLGFRPGEKQAYSHGETVTLVVRVRNVGKEAVKFEYLKQFLDEKPPAVTDADGQTIPQRGTTVLGFHFPVEVTLEPGKQVELESRMHGASGLRYELRPAGGGGKPTTEGRPLVVGTGKVSVQYEQVLGKSSSGGIKLDPTLGKLATGKLELEIESDPPPAATGKK